MEFNQSRYWVSWYHHGGVHGGTAHTFARSVKGTLLPLPGTLRTLRAEKIIPYWKVGAKITQIKYMNMLANKSEKVKILGFTLETTTLK